MNSECIYQLTEEQNNSCDSDYEFVNNGSSRENSDCELEGYKQFPSTCEVSAAPLAPRRLSKHFDTVQGEKLKLCLSPEKISLLANSAKHSAAREQRGEGQEQKAVKNRLVPSFTIVPINLGRGKGSADGRNESKADLPEIVLTSFEVGSAGKKAAASKARAAASTSGTMDTKKQSVVAANGCVQVPPPAVTAQTEFVFRQDDQSPSPESYVDNQLSAASSLSNRSSENSSESANSKEKPLTTTSEVVVLHQQSKNSIDCVQSSSVAPTALNSDALPDDLKCGICHNVYKDPRALQCLHSFCFQCLLDENFKQDSSIPFWSQPNQKEYDWKSTRKSSYSLKSTSAESSPETTYRDGSPASTRKASRSSFTSFRSKKSIDKLIAKDQLKSKKGETESPPNERHRFITCKECQQTTEIPVGGIRQLPENFVLLRKIEAMKLKIGNDVISKVWCSLCYVESNATYHCVTCTLNLCTFCKEAHERQRHTANHKIKNILELRKSRNARRAFINDSKFSIKCSMHPGFEMKAFCSSCLQVACADCLALLHKGHKHESITKAFGNYQKILKESTDQARPLCDYAHHSVNRLNEIAKRINKKCDNVQSDVEAFMASYTEAVEIHGRTLIQQINRARETKIQMIVEQQLDMEKRSAEAANVVRFSEELIESGTEVEILSFVNILLRRFEFCQKFKTPVDPRISDTLHFLPEVRAPSSKNQRNIPIFGIITTQTVEPTLCTLETEGYTQLRVHRRVEMTILSRDGDGLPLCHGGLKVIAQLKYKESSSKVLPVEVNDRRDGSYGIAFVPDSQGTMILTISINDKHIKGSPFTFAARTVRPHSGIYHCCTFCSSKGSKHATCSCDGRMPGYNGCGHGHNGHPGRRHWSCCGNVLENSECTAANKLLNP